MSRRLAADSPTDLVQAERDIRTRIGGQPLDFAAMAAVSNIYRAANVIRNRLERQILAGEDLSWAAFTVLFVLWIRGDQQTRHLADEAGVTKGTLTGVLKTLEKRGLTRRCSHEADGRLVLVSRYREPRCRRNKGSRPTPPIDPCPMFPVLRHTALLNTPSRPNLRPICERQPVSGG